MVVWRLFYVALAIAVALLGLSIYNLSAARGGLADTPANHAFGAEDADVTLTGFVDFACIHCRNSIPAVMDAIEKDGHVRFIPHLVHTGQTENTYNIKLTYAAGFQGKFREAFLDLMRNYRELSENDVTSFAAIIGVDAEQLRKDAESEDVLLLMGKATKVFLMLNGQRTPTFFINQNIKFIPETQTPTADDFLRMFAEARR